MRFVMRQLRVYKRRLPSGRMSFASACATTAMVLKSRSFGRVAVRDTEIGGVQIPAGAELYIVLGSANHDESVFPQPAAFDIRRNCTRHHLSFGKGIHFCLGAPLARMQAEVVLTSLTRLAPGMSLHPAQTFPYEENLATRSPKQLLVDIPAAGGQR